MESNNKPNVSTSVLKTIYTFGANYAAGLLAA